MNKWSKAFIAFVFGTACVSAVAALILTNSFQDASFLKNWLTITWPLAAVVVLMVITSIALLQWALDGFDK